MSKYGGMIRKLQNALNYKYSDKILINSTQFYSQQYKCFITMKHVKRAVWDDERKRYVNVELYRSPSEIRIVMFLRDLYQNYEKGIIDPTTMVNSQADLRDAEDLGYY